MSTNPPWAWQWRPRPISARGLARGVGHDREVSRGEVSAGPHHAAEERSSLYLSRG